VRVLAVEPESKQLGRALRERRRVLDAATANQLLPTMADAIRTQARRTARARARARTPSWGPCPPDPPSHRLLRPASPATDTTSSTTPLSPALSDAAL